MQEFQLRVLPLENNNIGLVKLPMAIVQML
jgi:hypothetical protein